MQPKSLRLGPWPYEPGSGNDLRILYCGQRGRFLGSDPPLGLKLPIANWPEIKNFAVQGSCSALTFMQYSDTDTGGNFIQTYYSMSTCTLMVEGAASFMLHFQMALHLSRGHGALQVRSPDVRT